MEKICVQDQVIQDLHDRKNVGLNSYGTLLYPFNGRNALVDLYEELLDACCYVKQFLIEYDELQVRLTAAGHGASIAEDWNVVKLVNVALDALQEEHDSLIEVPVPRAMFVAVRAERDDLADEVMRHQAGESYAVGYEYGVATAAKFKAQRDDLAARLSALTDAIEAHRDGWTVREGEMIFDRIADAVDGQQK
jgi:hypothetical protein